MTQGTSCRNEQPRDSQPTPMTLTCPRGPATTRCVPRRYSRTRLGGSLGETRCRHQFAVKPEPGDRLSTGHRQGVTGLNFRRFFPATPRGQ
jgi:hypothetical protein